MAARFLVTGGNGNWTSTGNWSATSGGGSGVSAPGSADDVTFDSNSGATGITVDTATQSYKTLTVTSGYTGTLTMTNSLSANGSTSLGANMIFAGAAALIFHATGTLTSNGKTIGVPVSIDAALTLTLADSATTSGGFTTSNVGIVLTGNTFNIGGGLTMNNITTTVSGTCNLVMNGTGTLSQPSSTTGRLVNNLEINTAGTITLSGTFRYGGGTFKYTAGTFVSTGSTLVFMNSASTLTVNSSGFTLATLQPNVGLTINGSNGFTMATLSDVGSNTPVTFLSGNTYTITSSLINTGTSAAPNSLASGTGSSDTFLNFTGSTMALAYCNMTDINASGGHLLQSYGATMTRTTNAVAITQITGGGVPRSRMI